MVAVVFCFRTDVVVIVLTAGSNAININKQTERHAYINNGTAKEVDSYLTDNMSILYYKVSGQNYM
jgi:hypothetical protein